LGDFFLVFFVSILGELLGLTFVVWSKFILWGVNFYLIGGDVFMGKAMRFFA
jgi:hypothetical protein